MPSLPIPIWPGRHRMPPAAEAPAIRWSAAAWEALYPDIQAPWWKPWPYAPEPLWLKPSPNTEFWEAFRELMALAARQPYRVMPAGWPDLRIYTCPGCMKPQYAPGYCGICGPIWTRMQRNKPYIIPIITAP